MNIIYVYMIYTSTMYTYGIEMNVFVQSVRNLKKNADFILHYIPGALQ